MKSVKFAMASDLTVGRLDEFDLTVVDDLFERFGRGLEAGPSGRWLDCAEDVATISVMNVASLNLFNHYAAGLEGISGLDAMNKTKFVNLPWWLSSLWLPISFTPPREPLSKDDPVFVGSCQGLLSELKEIQRLSDLGLGGVPDEYNVMRNDYRAWWKSVIDSSKEEQAPYSTGDTIRWIWRAFYDGAELSLKHDAPLKLL